MEGDLVNTKSYEKVYTIGIGALHHNDVCRPSDGTRPGSSQRIKQFFHKDSPPAAVAAVTATPAGCTSAAPEFTTCSTDSAASAVTATPAGGPSVTSELTACGSATAASAVTAKASERTSPVQGALQPPNPSTSCTEAASGAKTSPSQHILLRIQCNGPSCRRIQKSVWRCDILLC